MGNRSDSVDDKIGSGFAAQYDDQLAHEKTRKKMIAIFQEQIDTVSFSNKVKQYAAEEMDKRVFRSFQYWSVVVLTAILTTIISFIIGKMLGKI